MTILLEQNHITLIKNGKKLKTDIDLSLLCLYRTRYSVASELMIKNNINKLIEKYTLRIKF